MNNKKLVKNQPYVISTPSKSLLCFILVDLSEFNFNDEIFKAIEQIKINSDIFFVFYSPNSSVVKNPSRVKFASTEEAAGFVEMDNSSNRWGILLKTIDYMTSFYSSSYSGYTFTTLKELEREKLTDIDVTLATEYNLLGTPLVNPVLEIKRRPMENLKEIWEKEENKPTTPNPFSQLLLFLKGNEEDTEDLFQPKMFSTHNTSTLFPFFRPIFFKNLNRILEKNEDYLETFREETNFRIFLASVISRYKLPFLDRDPKLIELKDYGEV